MSVLKEYKKKPLVIKAYQWCGPSKDQPGVYKSPEEELYYVITIHNQKVFLEGGEYIIQEPDGIHYYPCKADIFENSYTQVVKNVVR